MRLGYNTNGFAHHRLEDALEILAELGYQSVALTLDHHALDPFSADLAAQCAQVKSQLRRLGLRCVIETGARFLLDPWRKHQPTLLSPRAEERACRLDFLSRAVTLAAELEADAVSFWSGTALAEEPATVLFSRLVAECHALCHYAETSGVRLAFEPEPGMLIERMSQFGQLVQAVGHPLLGLTLDIGHLHCLGEVPITSHIRQWQPLLWNIHLEDMRQGVHDHLMFGEGEIDFAPILQTLDEIAYQGGVHVELSRHSHNAVETARRALAFLQAHHPAQGSNSR